MRKSAEQLINCQICWWSENLWLCALRIALDKKSVDCMSVTSSVRFLRICQGREWFNSHFNYNYMHLGAYVTQKSRFQCMWMAYENRRWPQMFVVIGVVLFRMIHPISLCIPWSWLQSRQKYKINLHNNLNVYCLTILCCDFVLLLSDTVQLLCPSVYSRQQYKT